MRIWYQDQNIEQDNLKFAHPEKWTVLINPPNVIPATMRFDTEELAKVYVRSLVKFKDYASILPPNPRK